ncbi:MAG TPA: hypothetical protein VG605_21460, partial [Puia sp.]|nr:hypothetical protein [Puia sp.]
MTYSAKIYSRIGELMQGVLPDASAFLVSGLASRRWYSEAVIVEKVEPGGQVGASRDETGGRRFETMLRETGGRFQATLPPKAREALSFFTARTRQHLPAD